MGAPSVKIVERLNVAKFDLIEYQDKAWQCKSASDLYDLWDELCSMYNRGLVAAHELDELKGSIFPRINTLSQMQKEISNVFDKPDGGNYDHGVNQSGE